jgi:hypothetical protein
MLELYWAAVNDALQKGLDDLPNLVLHPLVPQQEKKRGVL